MKKGKRILITFIACYINFYSVVGILELTSLDRQLIMDIACVFFLLPIIVNLYITKVVIKREDILLSLKVYYQSNGGRVYVK